MKVNLDFPWERYAVIIELASRFSTQSRPLGKTALQKYVYFLQELYDVDVGYEFSLYTYGPFSAELMQDLDVTHAMGAVEVTYDPYTNAYNIRPGPKKDAIRNRASGFLERVKHALDQVLAYFGNYGARELELQATIVYAERDAKRRSEALPEDHLVQRVHEIKPHFSETEIHTAVRQLLGREYIQVAA